MGLVDDRVAIRRDRALLVSYSTVTVSVSVTKLDTSITGVALRQHDTTLVRPDATHTLRGFRFRFRIDQIKSTPGETGVIRLPPLWWAQKARTAHTPCPRDNRRMGTWSPPGRYACGGRLRPPQYTFHRSIVVFNTQTRTQTAPPRSRMTAFGPVTPGHFRCKNHTNRLRASM